MTGEFLREYHRAHYRGDNTVVALSGSFSQEILDELRRRFAAPARRGASACGAGGVYPCVRGHVQAH